MRKTFRFYVGLICLLVLFQNCSSNSSNVLTTSLIQAAGNSSGNGGTYNGVQAFVLLSPGFTCEGQSAPESILQRDSSGNWSVVQNSATKCAATTTPIASLDYAYPHHYQDYGGFTYSIDLLNINYVREFIIDASADPNSPNVLSGVGICANAQGQCSLRAAFDEMNSVDQPAILNIPAGTFDMNSTLNISIMSPVQLQGVAGQTILNGTYNTQGTILSVQGVSSSTGVYWSPTTIVNNIQFINANAGSDVGSAINMFEGSIQLNNDVFVNNAGTFAIKVNAANDVIVNQSVLHDNAALTTLQVAGGSLLKITTSEFYNDQLAVDSESNAGFDVESSVFYNNAQGLFMVNTCPQGVLCQLQNVTIANTQSTGFEVRSFVMGETFSDVTIRNSTIVGSLINVDYSKIDVGGQVGADHLVIQNSILSLGVNPSSQSVNCNLADPSPLAQQYLVVQNSIADDNSCGNSGFTIVNPQLQTLGMNGGPLPTILLAPTSPAIDTGNNLYCPTSDARGLPRPVNYLKTTPTATCDMGAVEMQ